MLFCLLLLGSYVQADQSKPAFLKSLLKTTTADSVKVQILHSLYAATDSLLYAKEALGIAEMINYKLGTSQALLDIGRSYYFDGKLDVALTNLSKSVAIAEELGAKAILINAYRYIGYIYRPNDPFVAQDYYNKSLKLAKETGDEISESYLLSALGNINENIYQGNTEQNRKALTYYLQSLEIRDRIGSDEEVASSLNETSRIYGALGFHAKALDLRLKGLEIARKAGSQENIVFLSNVIGNEYYWLSNFKKSLEFHLTAYNSAKTLKNDPATLYDITKGIAADYASLGDIKKSNEFYREATDINDSIFAKISRDQYNLSGLKHNLEQELESQKLLVKDAEIQQGKAEAGRQATLRNATLVVFAFILIIAVLLFRSYRLNQRTTRELALKNEKIETAYSVLADSENKFKLITESINDIFYLYNIRDKKYEYISPNCEAELGLSQQWFYDGNSMNVIVLEQDLPVIYEADADVIAGKHYEIEYRVIVNGVIKWIAEKSSPNIEANGNVITHSGICRDITAKKTAEDKFKLITETINDVFYLFNIKEKKYEYISPNCITLFGLEQQWIYEHNTSKSAVYKPDLPLVIDANVKIDSGIPYEIEYRVLVNDEIKWVHEKSTPIYDEKGNLVRNSGICRNITLRKTNEEIIASKSRDIRDSILYARTIQNAILVPEEEIAKRLKEFFILSKPKDIVSGDFYFFRETDDGLVIAVADCTGHGVPGGFMSMLGSAYLNEIINNNRTINPAQILDKLGKRIIRSLNQKADYDSNKDGMDITLLYFNKDFTSVQFAGAYNPVYLIRGGELQEQAVDKLPIGINIASEQSQFTNKELKLQKGDCLYLSTDGYSDQFGGASTKKFGKKQMKDLLLSAHSKQMSEQKKLLDKTFADWQGNHIQIDDVMIMGIRI
jgi:PAS domain S-box-containing protein